MENKIFDLVLLNKLEDNKNLNQKDLQKNSESEKQINKNIFKLSEFQIKKNSFSEEFSTDEKSSSIRSYNNSDISILNNLNISKENSKIKDFYIDSNTQTNLNYNSKYLFNIENLKNDERISIPQNFQSEKHLKEQEKNSNQKYRRNFNHSNNMIKDHFDLNHENIRNITNDFEKNISIANYSIKLNEEKKEFKNDFQNMIKIIKLEDTFSPKMNIIKKEINDDLNSHLISENSNIDTKNIDMKLSFDNLNENFSKKNSDNLNSKCDDFKFNENELNSITGVSWDKIIKEIEECNNQNKNEEILGVNKSDTNEDFCDIYLDKINYDKFLKSGQKDFTKWYIEYKKENPNLKIKEFIYHDSNSNITNKKIKNSTSLRRKSYLEKKYCKIKFENNEEFEGERLHIISDKINGYGVYKYNNGDLYEGDFIEGNRQGLGEYVYYDKTFYRGEWENDKKNGRGIYSNGEKEFNGIWKDNNFISGFIFDINKFDINEMEEKYIKNEKDTIKDDEKNEIEESYLDMEKISDLFEEYGTEKENSNFTYEKFIDKYKNIQKDYFYDLFFQNYDFFKNRKIDSEINIDDIIFNEKSIFKKYFNNMKMEKNNSDIIEDKNIENKEFLNFCPLKEVITIFNEQYNFDYEFKCDCQKIRQSFSNYIN